MELTEETIESSCGNYTRKVWISRSPGGEARKLCLFLDAEHYTRDMDALPVLEALREGGRIPPVTIVFVTHVSGEARHADYTCNAAYATFVAEDVVAWARRQDTLLPPEGNVLCGLSLSGLQAAFIALNHPKLFSYVLSQSGSFWWEHEWFASVAKKLSAAGQRYWLSVGDKETAVNVAHTSYLFQEISQIEGVEKAAELLTSLGGDVRYEQFEGGHAMVPWRKELPGALEWLLGDVGAKTAF